MERVVFVVERGMVVVVVKVDLDVNAKASVGVIRRMPRTAVRVKKPIFGWYFRVIYMVFEGCQRLIDPGVLYYAMFCVMLFI